MMNRIPGARKSGNYEAHQDKKKNRNPPGIYQILTRNQDPGSTRRPPGIEGIRFVLDAS